MKRAARTRGEQAPRDPTPRERRPTEFGNGVLAEAQADAAHGDFMWSAVRTKITMVIGAVGYAVYHLFTAN